MMVSAVMSIIKTIALFSFICLTLCIIPENSIAVSRLHPEYWYIRNWCEAHGGELRKALNDGTQCDCMTDDYVVEVEYANKWKNAIGKVLHYSLQSGKRSTIVLVLEHEREEVYFRQLQMLIRYFSLPIDIWKTGPGKMTQDTPEGLTPVAPHQ